jgi:hypothetical protein
MAGHTTIRKVEASGVGKKSNGARCADPKPKASALDEDGFEDNAWGRGPPASSRVGDQRNAWKSSPFATFARRTKRCSAVIGGYRERSIIGGARRRGCLEGKREG